MTGCLSFVRGNALTIPLADKSVALIVTSPPYFNLRSYRDEGEHFDGQLGSESSPFLFLANLWATMDEAWRVLRDDGNAWVNLGDKFAQDPASAGGIRPKTRMALPHRFYEGCIDPEYRAFTEQRAGFDRADTERRLTLPPEDGGYPQWVGRLDVVWAKSNGMPSSAQDRCRDSHEYWFHLTKEERYFSALDELRSSLPTSGGSLSSRGLVVGGPAPDATASGTARGPELRVAVDTEDGTTIQRGWCQIRPLEQTIDAAVTRDAERFQILGSIGLNLRVETPVGDYVVDFEALGAPTSNALVPIAVLDAFPDIAPVLPSVDGVAASPVGVALAGMILPNALHRAEVATFDVTLRAGEGLVARLTLKLDERESTLLVWDALPTHKPSLAQRSGTLGRPPGSVWEFPSEPLVGVPEFMVLDDPDSLHPTSYLKDVDAAWEWWGAHRSRFASEITRRVSEKVDGVDVVVRWEPYDEQVWEAPDPRRLVSAWPRDVARWEQLYAMPDHFAAFGSQMVKRIILGWSPSGVCVLCGDPRRPVKDRATNAEAWADLPLSPGIVSRLASRPRDADPLTDALSSGLSRPGWRKNPPPPITITGYACSCPTPDAPTRPSVVVDPFSGTGTTAVVAAALGRHGIGVELSADYLRLARWRDEDGGLRCKALGVEKPPRQVRGQEALF